MSQENVERLREAFDNFLAGKSEWGAELVDPNVEWDGTNALIFDIDRVYHGQEGVRQYWREWLSAWETVQFEYELVDAGDSVVVATRIWARGKGSGVEGEMPQGMVYSLRNGLVTRVDLYESKRIALEAVGLSEQDAHADS